MKPVYNTSASTIRSYQPRVQGLGYKALLPKTDLETSPLVGALTLLCKGHTT
ncbi:hypothetical protein Mapa_015209 [Marchantia paleacea]|nr:hypothetical protein Mapa_015209 [Marchantia paleacea]